MRRQYKELKTKFQGMREAYIQEKGSLLHCGNIIQSRKRIRTETESANSHWFLEQSGLEATCFLWCLKFSVGVFHRGQRPLSTEAPSRALVDLKNVWVGLQEIEAVINKETVEEDIDRDGADVPDGMGIQDPEQRWEVQELQ